MNKTEIDEFVKKFEQGDKPYFMLLVSDEDAGNLRYAAGKNNGDVYLLFYHIFEVNPALESLIGKVLSDRIIKREADLKAKIEKNQQEGKLN